MTKSRKGKDVTEPKRLRRDEKNTQKNCTKKILMNRIAKMVWLVTQSQTFLSVKSSGH